ncbi:2-dehydropantoate 2-reductase [Nocardioides euryhalodurans]|uniref:2-dehydropantoate 2-reductase n=1 Tax=Nocardioides euryhalodurans TaxID=2518370 RepID=A0A4P7GPK0_9ACTN|nr:2-dehydropantoate 2-reductase [Nocardioides euryhalodurans]QBR94060.1 2-dehydropantoate 2-reductase [Nocardioides euryhalodurans]
MRIAVIGAGGIGGYFGGRLAQAGHDVTFVARGDHLAAIRRDGLHVASVGGDFHVGDVRATDDPSGTGAVDLVLVAVKSWQLAGALPLLGALVGDGTAVVTTQNGVEAPEQVAAAVGRTAVLPGAARIFAMVTSPGVVSHVGGPATIAFGEWDDRRSERVSRLLATFTGAAVEAGVPDRIWAELWTKMLTVVPLGGLGAALDATVGEVRSRHRGLLEAAMAEVVAVARARGVELPDGIVPRTLGFLEQQPERATTSLHRDVVAGLPSELDAWTGAVVRLGAESGVPVPVHRTLLAVLTEHYPNALA